MQINDTKIVGGIPALRGFRKQFLHTLRRIIESETNVIYPETIEDFAIYNNSGNLIELIQVKDYNSPLTFSDLKTFFKNAIKVLQKNSNVNIILASYGELGKELKDAIASDEKTLKKPKFNTPEILNVLSKLTYTQLKEEHEISIIKEFINQYPMMAGEWQTAFDILMQDLYTGAENEKAYTCQTLKENLQNIGRYLVEREAHHKEWGTTIIPLIKLKLEKTEERLESFFEGVSASWSHISANLDIVRGRHLKRIEAGFEKSNIVIIHGASGQGKSALAYRYLYDYCPSGICYEILDLETSKRALEVATALAGYKVPLYLFFDASCKDKGLSSFLKRISQLKYINCLIAIREEDWRMTGLTSAEFQFSELELEFNQEEAKRLYDAWQIEKNCQYLDFEQAWAKFNEDGPLLEFIHLLTHTESLSDRLRKQYERVVDEVDRNERSENDIKLMHFVAIAGASGSSIDLKKISGSASLKRSIDRLEKEYFLRLDTNGRYLTGLHPIRSRVLSDIITDPAILPWGKLALECLPFLKDDDFEIFLLHSFIDHPEATQLIVPFLDDLNHNSWIAVNCILRALQWKGIYDYVQENKELFEQVYDKIGGGCYVLLDLDFIGILDIESAQSSIFDLLPGNGKEQAQYWRKSQTSKSNIFYLSDNWLNCFSLPPIPSCEKEWNDFGQVSYWIGFREIKKNLYDYLDFKALEQVINNLPLHILGNLIFGLWNALSNGADFLQWYDKIYPSLLNRYRIETNSPYIEINEKVIRAHFIAHLEDKETINKKKKNGHDNNRFHDMALYQVELLARLFPNYEGYGCQGYGHHIFDFYKVDDTTKTKIDAKYLTPDWIIEINKIARILISHLFRPKTWKEYCTQIYETRDKTVQCLDELRKILIKHFRSKKIVKQLGEISTTELWKECVQLTSKTPCFPLEALDAWGYSEEQPRKRQFKTDNSVKEKFILSAYLKKYQDYLKIKSKFFQELNNFLNQSPQLLLTNSFLGKAKNIEERSKYEKIIQELNIKNTQSFLPGYNLAQALKSQAEFQHLFRKHFVGLLENDNLLELERKELQVVQNLWPLWFLFINKPERHMDFPGKAGLIQLDKRIQEIQNSIKEALKKLETKTLTYTNLGDSIKFDRNPALWIAVNGKNPLEVYSQMESLFSAIKKSIGIIKLHSLEYYALEFKWKNILFIPLCSGKLLDENVWVVPTYQLVNDLNQNGELSIVNLIPQQLNQETIDQLDLKFYPSILLKDARLFFQNISVLQLRLQHMTQLGSFPDLDEAGTKIIQAYFDELQEELSKNLQETIDGAAILSDLYNKKSKSSYENPAFEYLQLATEQLAEIHEKIIPNGIENGTVRFTIDSLEEWKNQIQSIQEELFVIYLYWCGYIINT